MTIQNVSRSKPFAGSDLGREHNELVHWHSWFCRMEEKDGKNYLVLKSYEGPELKFLIEEGMIDPETNLPFRNAHSVHHAVVCALHNSVRCLVGRALGNQNPDDRSGWRASPDGKERFYGYDMLDWEDK